MRSAYPGSGLRTSVLGNLRRHSFQLVRTKGYNSRWEPLRGPEIASPLACCQRLPVSLSLWTSFPDTMLSYSKCNVLPLNRALNTAPVLQVPHQVTSIGPSGIWSFTEPCC